MNPGSQIGSYHLIDVLGQGGMGCVWRAEDSALGREVAVKVLPEDFADDGERHLRFEREAKLLASLNHPNIATLYGLEHLQGQHALIMELVTGEGLEEVIARGPIPVDEAIAIAEQIAEALEAAHEAGVVHRDLKPANVRLRGDGTVKVLDFGLAKAWEGRGVGDSLSMSPTVTRQATAAGVILGTAAYMSPEQARGKPVDRRTDIWAFGVVLWEMLTGQSLFAGDTITDVIAAVVKEEPDLTLLPTETPLVVRRLLERCLRKDVRTRLPDIGAARLELQDWRAGRSSGASTTGSDASPTGTLVHRHRWRTHAAWAGAAALGIAAALVLTQLGRHEPARPPVGHFVVDPPSGWRFHSWGWPVPSPDGSQLLFRAVPESTPVGYANEDQTVMLWVRHLGSLTSRLLEGTEHVQHPFWSPDGQSVGFSADGELRRLSLANGTVQQICALPLSSFPGGADWRADGTIAFEVGTELFTVAATGGDPRPFAPPGASDGGPMRVLPQFLADQQHIGFVSSGEEVPPGYYVAPLDAPEKLHKLVDGITRVKLARQHALFVQGNVLVAQPFDAGRLSLTGAPVVLASSLGFFSSYPGVTWFDVSAGGTLAYFDARSTSGDVQLTWLDRSGTTLATVGEPGEFGQLVLSPDERNAALAIRSADDDWDLWVIDLARGVPSRLTMGPGDENNPIWSPDGSELAFSESEEGTTDLRRKGLWSGDPETVLVDSPDADYPENWSPDATTLLYVRRSDAGRQTIWALSLEGQGEPEPILTSDGSFDEPQLSPDARWLASISDESGRFEVYVEPFRRDGERIRVSVDGGGQPKWRGDGKELFFTDLDGHLKSVAFRTRGDRPEVDLPTDLFALGSFTGPEYDDYAPSADGQRFLVKLPLEQGQPAQLHVVLNWPSLLVDERR